MMYGVVATACTASGILTIILAGIMKRNKLFHICINRLAMI